MTMKKRFFPVLLLAAVGGMAGRASAQAIVIANPGVKAAEVSKSDLRDVFTGASGSLSGSKVTPVLLKSGAATEEFLAAYVGKSDSAFLAGWRSLIFSGQASMPKTVDSESAMVDYVAHTPGAVGYIAKGAAHEGVKVLDVK
jgi:ABC-type phosphate transport system substrate-binding protein